MNTEKTKTYDHHHATLQMAILELAYIYIYYTIPMHKTLHNNIIIRDTSMSRLIQMSYSE